MNKVVERIDQIREVIRMGMKILSSEEDKGKVNKINIITGIDMTVSPPQVLVSSISLKSCSETEEFLSSAFFQKAIYRPVKRGIVLLDVVGYSKGDNLMQAAFLSIFNSAIKYALDINKISSNGEYIEQIIPTGDGCYIIFKESINDRFFKVVFSLISAMNVVQNHVLKEFGRNHKVGERINLKVGCTLEETDFFYDLAGNRNCYGVGMNETSRILTYGQKTVENKYKNESTDDSIFLGENVFSQAEQLYQHIKKIDNNIKMDFLGDIKDKHDKSRKIWWMRGGSKNIAISLYSPGERPTQ